MSSEGAHDVGDKEVLPSITVGVSEISHQEMRVDAEIEARITKKLDRRVVPWLFGLWLLAFIDRSNIGNARIDGLATELNLGTGPKYNTALAIFYVSYLCVDIPSNWLLKRVGAGYYLPGLVVGWGIVTIGIGFVTTYSSLLAVRFLLGIFEGGILGGIILYLSMFYRRHQLMRRIGLFYCAAPLSGAFGGLLATGLSQITTPRYNGWPFIFFAEGGITVLFSLLTIFFLPHTPGDCKFLTKEEIYAANHYMKLDAHGSASEFDVKEEKFSWHWIKLAFNINTILLSIDFFAVITPIYSFSLFLPTIISALGYTRVNANLMSVPPNVAAFLTVILTTYLSDKYKQRGVFIIGGASVSIIGYIMLISSTRPLIQYGGTFLVGSGIFPMVPMMLGWLANNTGPYYARATATGFQIAFANSAAFIATFTYIATDAPRYITGHAINIGVLCLCLMVTSVTILYCKMENSKRERGEREDRLTGDQNLLGHRHPSFRYTI